MNQKNLQDAKVVVAAAVNLKEKMAALCNPLMDKLVSAVAASLKSSDQTMIAAPDMDERFDKLMMSGGVKATEGTLEDLSTLRRAGDVTVSLAGGSSATISVDLSLGVLKLFYPRCKAWLGSLNTENTLTVVVGKNKIRVSLTVDILRNCKTKLDQVKVKDLSDIKVNFKGSSKILGPIVEVVVKYLHGRIETIVEKELNEVLQQEVDKISFSSVFSAVKTGEFK